jgi:lysozyme family protein
MKIFERALKHTLGIEGDYVNDPRDSGGATRYGITEAKARAWGYTGPMSQLPLDLAKRIYRADFWDIIRLDQVAALSPALALEMFDTGVNCGIGIPVRFLQQSLNALNREGVDYPDLAVDGVIGQNTLAALGIFLRRRGENGSRVIVEMLNCLQGHYYIDLVERRPKDEAFIFGWFLNRVVARFSP